MAIRPLHDRVVVKRLEDDTTSAGGILIPDNAKEKPSRGEILAVGPGKRCENGSVQELTVRVGDKVMFGKYAGTEVKVDGQEVVIMKEEDILAIIEK